MSTQKLISLKGSFKTYNLFVTEDVLLKVYPLEEPEINKQAIILVDITDYFAVKEIVYL